jgi:hypothetical protein
MWTQGTRAIAAALMILGMVTTAYAAPRDSQTRLDEIIRDLPPPVIKD